jgi:hypothetical protein
MPPTSLKTTTIAGTLVRSTLRVPVPCPPPAAAHSFHVMPVTVLVALAHPTTSVVGRTCGVDPGPQDRTAGGGVVVVVGAEVLVERWSEVVEVLAAVDFVGGEDLEPTATPTAIPTPRATNTRATTLTRTTVLRRTVTSLGSLSTTEDNGSAWR